MFSYGALLLLALLALVLVLWYESLRIREAVTDMCREVCRRTDLQLLDQSASLASISVRRSPGNGFQVYRVYQFDVSTSGTDRRPGYVILAGKTVEAIHVEEEDGMLTLYPAERPRVQ